MAEGLFIHLVNEAGLSDKINVESAGTSGWHMGELPDERMSEIAQGHGITLPSRSRKIRHDDFLEFDYIIPMDESNLHDLQKVATHVQNPKATIIKMRFFDEMGLNEDVPDPYYGGQGGFEDVYQMLLRANEGFLNFIREQNKI
ncbi:UNVERIFIED_CONTAM: hypothetical protein GTU68_044398 [Idotea baltica]|nr:hypothetical protein [Idotea baltica]